MCVGRYFLFKMVSILAFYNFSYFCAAKGDQSISLQARFIAQIIIVGAQVVGRAFTQALRQEFQSKFKWCNRLLTDNWNVFTYFFGWIGSQNETSIVLCEQPLAII